MIKCLITSSISARPLGLGLLTCANTWVFDGSETCVEAPVTEGMATMVATPVDFSATTWSVARRAPEVGEHTEEILLERGLTWEQISELREAGALG